MAFEFPAIGPGTLTALGESVGATAVWGVAKVMGAPFLLFSFVGSV